MQPELTQEQKAGLEGTLRELESKLKGAGAGDVESLEAAAVTAANLGQYAKSEDLLVKLSAIKKDDPDVWRLLAEVRLVHLGTAGVYIDRDTSCVSRTILSLLLRRPDAVPRTVR